MYKAKGLVYRILDKNGKKIGVPIKASAMEGKPTLKNLEKKFVVNAVLRQPYATRIKECIDDILKQQVNSLNEIIQGLKGKGIDVRVQQNKTGAIDSITYVDHRAKCVFNGNNLGKEYDGAAIQSLFSATKSSLENFDLKNEESKRHLFAMHQSPSNKVIACDRKDTPIHPEKAPVVHRSKKNEQTLQPSFKRNKLEPNKMVQQLIDPKQPMDLAPASLLQKKRKKKRNQRL